MSKLISTRPLQHHSIGATTVMLVGIATYVLSYKLGEKLFLKPAVIHVTEFDTD